MPRIRAPILLLSRGMVVRSLHIGALLLMVVALSSCGRKTVTAELFNKGAGSGPACGFPIASNRQNILQNFPLLVGRGYAEPWNQYVVDGVPGAPTDPMYQGAPFGALIVFKPQEISYCTVTHMTPGNALTAAHCVEHSNNPGDYYLVFYNKSGQRSVTRIYDWGKGSSNSQDIAVVRVCPEGTDHWDTAGADIAPSANAGPMQVKVWAYDPIKNYQNIAQRYGSMPGMIFHPKTCTASRTVPTVKGFQQGNPTPDDIREPKVQGPMHLLMDACSSALISGNSGSLVTLASNFAGKVANYHWGVTPDGDTPYSYYAYWGTTGAFRWMQPNGNLNDPYNPQNPNFDFFEVGTAFDTVTDSGIRFSNEADAYPVNY